ncbi:MAG: hypothetical protein RI987_4, partial [Actinomycetota bacterium]
MELENKSVKVAVVDDHDAIRL